MKVICYGDSNTYGYDPRSYIGGRYPASDRWVDLLAEKTGWEVENRGLNGREIPGHSISVPGDTGLLIVMLGTNDLLQGASAEEAAVRMEAFLNQMLPHCKHILLIAPPPLMRGAWVPDDQLVSESIRLGEEYKALAEKLNISFVDTRDWNIEMAFDGVHFTESGHGTFAAKMAIEIKKSFGLCPIIASEQSK